MPIVIGPDTTNQQLGVLDRQSPYSLLVNGVWLQLDGVTPGTSRTSERPRSEIVTVDGYRYAQQAPRAAREWALSWEYAGPATVTAIQLAAEAPGEVWLHDAAAARANMLDPRGCYGHDQAAPVIDCGGIPLRALLVATQVGSLVRGGMVSVFACWTSAAAGAELLTLTYPGGTTTVVASAGVGHRRVEVPFAAPATGALSVSTVAGALVSGLQLTEGESTPRWLAGERTPCQVVVADPDRTLNLNPTGRPSRSDYAVALREVG